MLLTFSINASASIHIEGGTLISHKEWHNVNLPKKFIHAKNIALRSVTTAASAAHDYGHVNTNAYAHGTTAFDIHNDQSSSENYYVDRYLCIFNTSCTHSRDTISLAPNGHGYDRGSPIFTVMYFSKTGNYPTQCVIDVSGPNHGHASAAGTLTIN
jgi:hypothetical protein